ncbi:phosphotransferase family protein [Paenibacillus sp. BR1-192]|uniref:aminoglycoside phosphotransferase family protein n=1 Tax=Paenibacillus sp. BR1-192 TaxID=3032287 RepID=UPI00240DEC83|nr:phosphotransferase family protein [Paenibacillus sp. BR1-192]WFB57030.1 phosphotransferase family protein [Paenibacillus sp. BR1-192]
MQEAIRDIPGADGWIAIQAVDKGWSADRKYYIQDMQGEERLLRLSDISQFERKKWEFETVKKLDPIEMRTSRPIDFGVCHGGRQVYSLFTWVPGEDAREAIPLLDSEEQYRLGVQAGAYLNRMHGVPADSGLDTWASYYNSKMDRYIKNYESCGIRLAGAENIVRFMEAHRYLLEERPVAFQHGDYHVGNMVVTPEGELGIIDFNRADYGDPWEEFNRITWDASISPWFASGRIHGYFQGREVPDPFFRLMALYIASNQISSIHWAIPFGEQEVEVMMNQAQTVLNWYDGFRTHVPNWYITNAEVMANRRE